MENIAATAPDLMIAHVAQVTERIRLGAGGVMIPNHAPLQVVERYRTLEALHPGRVDLGIGRAPGTDPLTSQAPPRRARSVHWRAHRGAHGVRARRLPGGSSLRPHPGGSQGRAHASHLATRIRWRERPDGRRARQGGTPSPPTSAPRPPPRPSGRTGNRSSRRRTFRNRGSSSGWQSSARRLRTRRVNSPPPSRSTFKRIRSGERGPLPSPSEARDLGWSADAPLEGPHGRAAGPPGLRSRWGTRSRRGRGRPAPTRSWSRPSCTTPQRASGPTSCWGQ